jgi:hypothetical protein
MTEERTPRALPMALIIVIVAHCLELAIGTSIWFVLDGRARTSIASKLGTEPTWDSVETYIADQFTIGTPRMQLLERAAEIGVFRIKPFFIGAQYCETYYFKLGPFWADRAGPWNVCFDDEGIVTRVERYYFQ